MKKVIAGVFLLLGLSLGAQFPFGNNDGIKVKNKKGIIHVNKKEYLKMDFDKLLGDYTFFDLRTGQEVVYAKYVEYHDPNVWNERPARWDGDWDYHSVSYYEVHVKGMDDFFETDLMGKYLAKTLYKYSIVSALGSVDTANARKFMERRGKDHTRRRDELKNSNDKVIIIENRNNAPAPIRNRVGVRVGGVNVELND